MKPVDVKSSTYIEFSKKNNNKIGDTVRLSKYKNIYAKGYDRKFFLRIFQHCLVFIPAKKHIKYFAGTTWIELWKSNGMPEEKIENITKSDSNFAPTFVDHYLLPDMTFNGHCLIKNDISIPKELINPYIFYALSPQLRILNPDFTLGNCLFRSVKLNKNAYPDKYKYTSYSIGFYWRSESLFTDGRYGKNVIIFGADMRSSVHVDNKGTDILILGEGPTQGLDDTTLTAETKYPINFTQSGKRFVLSLHYNGSNNLLFVNTPNISKDFTINNMKKTGLKRVVNFFSVDFNLIDTNDVLDIHKYLMKRT